MPAAPLRGLPASPTASKTTLSCQATPIAPCSVPAARRAVCQSDGWAVGLRGAWWPRRWAQGVQVAPFLPCLVRRRSLHPAGSCCERSDSPAPPGTLPARRALRTRCRLPPPSLPCSLRSPPAPPPAPPRPTAVSERARPRTRVYLDTEWGRIRLRRAGGGFQLRDCRVKTSCRISGCLQKPQE